MKITIILLTAFVAACVEPLPESYFAPTNEVVDAPTREVSAIALAWDVLDSPPYTTNVVWMEGSCLQPMSDNAENCVDGYMTSCDYIYVVKYEAISESALARMLIQCHVMQTSTELNNFDELEQNINQRIWFDLEQCYVEPQACEQPL